MDITNIKLGIGLPLTDEKVYKQFLVSWTMVVAHTLCLVDTFDFLIPQFPSGDFPFNIAALRNSIVKQALENECTHLCMMDTDQIYPSDTIIRLLQHDLPVVHAKVHRRYPPFDPMVLRGKEDQFLQVSEEEWKSGNLIQIDASGTGCVLYKTEVFYDIDYPWFEFSKSKGGKDIGEDIGFCIKLKEAGYNIHMDTSIKVDHLATMEVNEHFYDIINLIRKCKTSKGE